MGLTKHEIQTLQSTFSKFQQHDINFVIPRKYENLPNKVQGDVDIQVEADDFERVIELCKSLSFTIGHSTSNEIIDLCIRAVSQPQEALHWIKNKPRDIIDEIKKSSQPYSGGSYDYKSAKLDYQGLRLDLKNRLAYRSPMNGQRIRVDPKVEKKLYQRKIKKDEYYVPSPPDELAHIVSHCIFDKEGVFSDYYKERCDTLLMEIDQEEIYHSQFQELLSLLFFEADELVMIKLKNSEYDELREELYSFDGY